MTGIRCVLAAFLVVAAIHVPAHAAQPPCERTKFEGSAFVVCKFDSRAQEFRLYLADARGKPLRGFRALGPALGGDVSRLRFAMNAGMFDDRGEAIGLYVENGAMRHTVNANDGPGNFHLKPNGVFWIGADGSVHADTTDAYIALNAHPVWATQSGPMLVIAGALHPAVAPDGPSRHVRNGVGVRDAHSAVFAISEDLVSFGRFARFFRDAMQCPNALYLDGAISSLWVPALRRQDQRGDVGPMIVVLDRAP